MSERIAKFIAQTGLASRRKAEELVCAGKVRLNGAVVTNPATLVDPTHDAVKVNNKLVRHAPYLYVMFHKPGQVITTKSDEYGRRTVLDALPAKFRTLHPVGRLDGNTTGLLLLTNDGVFTNRLTHPKFGVTKTYEVLIKGLLKESDRERLRRGVHLDDGTTQPADVVKVEQKTRATAVVLRLREGRKREVRRMFAVLGYEVLKLKRVAVGAVRLGPLRPGEYRMLTPAEVRQLKECAHEV